MRFTHWRVGETYDLSPELATLLIVVSTLFLLTMQWLQRRAERQKLAITN